MNGTWLRSLALWVSSGGLVEAVATGTAVVKATYQGSSGTFTLTVTQ